MVCYFDNFSATIPATDDGMKIIENWSFKPENDEPRRSHAGKWLSFERFKPEIWNFTSFVDTFL